MFKDTSRPCQMIDIQHCIAIMGGREVSRPYQFCFFMFLFQSLQYLCAEPYFRTGGIL